MFMTPKKSSCNLPFLFLFLKCQLHMHMNSLCQSLPEISLKFSQICPQLPKLALSNTNKITLQYTSLAKVLAF